MTIAELLTASRVAHTEYRQHAGQIDKEGKLSHPYHEGKCESAIKKALQARLQAEELDPQRKDPAWRLDKVPHNELVQFYESWLNS